MTSIYVTAGQRRYVGGTITEVSGKDISAATFRIGLSPDASTLPTSWFTPDVSTVGATSAQRIIKLLVSSTVVAGGSQITLPGSYVAWGDITDSPEIEPIVLQTGIVAV